MKKKSKVNRYILKKKRSRILISGNKENKKELGNKNTFMNIYIHAVSNKTYYPKLHS